MLGETPQIFPAASDYHLVCLQHDDSAEMIIDGESMQAMLGVQPYLVLNPHTHCCQAAHIVHLHDVAVEHLQQACLRLWVSEHHLLCFSLGSLYAHQLLVSLDAREHNELVRWTRIACLHVSQVVAWR